jgi:uncharacterized membrane protein YbhN (UPF0104 family)
MYTRGGAVWAACASASLQRSASFRLLNLPQTRSGADLSRKRLFLWLGTSLGLLLFAALLLHYEPESVFAPLLRSRFHILVTVTVILAAIQLLNAVSPVVLLGRPQEGELTWWSRTRAFLALQPLTLFAPGRLSDFGALPLLSRFYAPGRLASSIVLDRLVTLFFLLLMTPLALRLVIPGGASGLIDLIVAVCLVLVGALPFLLTNRRVRDLANRTLLRLSPGALRGFAAHTKLLLHSARTRLLLNLILTALKTVLSAATISLLAGSMGLSLDLLTATWMSVLVQLATSVPLSIQGIGVAEGSLAGLFALNGLPGALALSISVISRILLLAVMAVIYFTTTMPLLSEQFGSARD